MRQKPFYCGGRFRGGSFAAYALSLFLIGGSHGIAGEPDWGGVSGPIASAPQAIGGYTLGCLAGAAPLALNGPGYQVMRPSRGRYFGHPELIEFVRWLGNRALSRTGSGILIGDLAQARGGPMTSGHASHQSGLDADIWYLSAPDRLLSSDDRETLSAVSMVSANGLATTERWTADHAELLRIAASHPQVERIFVNAAVKRELCKTVVGERGWLSKIRPWWGHDHHFHVRLACPGDSLNCRAQVPPPASEGCDEGLQWWFSKEATQALADQKKQPSKAIALSDLPAECTAVYSATWTPTGGTGTAADGGSIPLISVQGPPGVKPLEQTYGDTDIR